MTEAKSSHREREVVSSQNQEGPFAPSTSGDHELLAKSQQPASTYLHKAVKQKQTILNPQQHLNQRSLQMGTHTPIKYSGTFGQEKALQTLAESAAETQTMQKTQHVKALPLSSSNKIKPIEVVSETRPLRPLQKAQGKSTPSATMSHANEAVQSKLKELMKIKKQLPAMFMSPSRPDKSQNSKFV